MQSYSAESERELFPLSWLTQYGYCPRRCGLMALEQLWTESADTAAGRAQHERVHTARDAPHTGARLETCCVIIGIAPTSRCPPHGGTT